jgi:CarboxypepD_reg-like domain/TonB-dependent Receptor Plug Domain
MKKVKLLLLLFFAGLFKLSAQNVKGRITDAQNGAPIESASVYVKGSKKVFAITNSNGDFIIKATPDATLIISSLGYESKEVKADAGSIVLNKASNTLGDVVVVGYGTQKRANLTGSVVSLNNASITKRQVSSTSQVLQGLAPGVTIQQQSGKPGADGASIRIRGESSILGNSTPLFVIDGIQMPTGTGLDAF